MFMSAWISIASDRVRLVVRISLFACLLFRFGERASLAVAGFRTGLLSRG